MTLDQHLAHLVWLMTVPAESDGWKAYAWARAKELAAKEPELADLPRLLTEAMSK
jgi:hypothetical protein